MRARWSQEDQGRGTWNIVVTEIPYQVQKARLIEKIAELLIARKLPLLDDVRDESAEDIRVVLVPKSRTVDPGLLMESLFKLTELEVRFPLNMNVLSRGKVPNVLSLKACCGMARPPQGRAGAPLAPPAGRDRAAAGDPRRPALIAYLNIDEVIRIIREEDEPKQVMMARWSLTDAQAEAILNMRLRALRKLEEFEIRKEFDELSKEKAQIEALLGSEAKQWKTVRWEVAKIRKKFGPDTDDRQAPHHLRRRARPRSSRHPAGHDREGAGHGRRLGKGLAAGDEGPHLRPLAVHLQGGRQLKLAFPAQTTDKILVFTTGGKFYTIGADRLPGGRGHGEPIRIIVDMENDQDIVTAFVHDPKRKLLLVSHEGNGFIVPEAEVVANTRKGKQVMNVKAPDEAALHAGRRATTSPSSARTARCWSSRSTECPKWRAARACACSATRTAACWTSRPSPSRRA